MRILILALFLIVVFVYCSENYLQPLDEAVDYCFPNLKTLVCGSMRLTWNDLIKLSRVFPNLEELRVPSNNITNLDTPTDNHFKNLKILALENNEINEWSEVCKLSQIPTLQHLLIDYIRLKSIKFEKCHNQSLKIFENLKKLAISNNFINDASYTQNFYAIKLIEYTFSGNQLVN